MKKILLGIVTTIVVLAIAITNVNAATVSATKEVKKGEKVTVTVELKDPATKLRATVSYDASKFEYVANSATCGNGALVQENATTAGTVTASAATTATVQKMTFTFIAKETTDASNFTISNLNPSETIDPATVSVKVVEESKPEDNNNGNETQKPGQEENKGDQTQTQKPSTTDDKKEKRPTVIPQAGVPYISLVVVGMAIVAIVSVKKIVK